MLQCRIGRMRVGISIWFAAFFAVILFVNDNAVLLYGLLAMVCHELGHFAVMLAVGCPVRGFYLFMGRLIIVPGRHIELSGGALPVLLGGVAANAICAAVFGLHGNAVAALTNLFIALYNLLPAGQLDGGAILLHLLNRRMLPKRAYLTHLWISFAVSFLLLTAGIFLLLRGYRNGTFLFSGVYLLAQNIQNMRYTKVG